MTRKEALQDAINLIQKASIGKKRKAQIIAGLTLCQEELPFAKWSKEAVFDACDQFVKDHGHIRLGDFNCAGLPSHPTIQNRFGMTAKTFRDTYYPLPEDLSRYNYDNRDKWNKKFEVEFHRIRCTSGQHYNRARDKGLPTFQTMVRINQVGCWTSLLESLDLSTYHPEHPKVSAHIMPLHPKPELTITVHPYDEGDGISVNF